jgi:Mor family transcriptional regulator
MKLSDDIKRLIEIIGKKEAKRICLKFMRRTVYFPENKKNCNNELIVIFGDKFNAVYREFKGGSIYFPVLFKREELYNKIRKDFWEKNMPYRYLVKKYKMSIGHIRKICREKY